jgi:hypothetical protein
VRDTLAAMSRWLVLVLCTVAGTSGCNWAFGVEATQLEYRDAGPPPDGDPRVDLDRDGVKDVEDPCIAPEVDGLIDSDFDGIANALDPCPLHNGVTPDSDGDGIADACDPSPEQDRVRCVMGFADPDFDVEMWRPRETPATWEVHFPRYLTTTGGGGSVVADWPFESPAITTYELFGFVQRTTTRFTVLPRAARQPSTDEVGCTLEAGSPWTLTISGSVGRVAVVGAWPGDFSAPFWMQVSIAPHASGGKVTLRCAARLGTSPVVTIEDDVQLPYGTLGFVSDRVFVRGIVVYERDDAR